MKLISCHIRNFGKLSNKDYNFKDGINSFIEDNGSGKSTLAAFIKAMLYGMDSIKTSTKDFKDRQHYAPFNEQSYGGTLIFTHEGKEYRMERTFDVKSSAKDITTIYVDKAEQSFEEEIGEVVLGLDKESFERLLFLEPKDIKMESSGNIRKNLNNIIDDSAEGVDFDALIENLDETIKKYSSKKNSLTSELKEKKKALEETIANQLIISNALKDKYIKRNGLNEQLIDLQSRQRLVSDQKAVLEYWNVYQTALKTIKEKKESLNELLAKYPKGLPTSEEIVSIKKLFINKVEINASIKSTTFDENKLTTLNVLKDKFKDGIPSEEDIKVVEQKIAELNKLSTLQEANNVELSDEENNIVSRFNTRDFEKDLAKVNGLVDEYKNIDDLLKSTPKLEEQNIVQNNKKSKVPIFVLIPAILLICAGIAMFFVLLPLGIGLTAAGVLGLFASGFLYLKNRIDNTNKGGVTTNAEFTKLETSLRQKAEEIHQVLTPYGIYTQSIYSDFERFKNELSRYQEILRKQSQSESASSDNKKAIDSLRKEIKNLIGKYIASDDYVLGIQKLKDEISEYNRLSSAHNEYLNKKELFEKKLHEVEEQIKAFDDKYGLSVLSGKQLLDDIATELLSISRLQKEIKEAKEKAEQYKNDKGLKEEPVQLEVFDYSEMIQGLNSEIATIDSQIDSDERDIENLEDNKQTLDEIKGSIKDCEHKFDILSKLKEELIKSQKRLDDKYVAPIMDRFDYYSKLLGDLLKVKIEMGRKFDIVLNVDGKLKSDEHLSSGQRSICALCFRLALLDNIYGGSLPFIVMDDPFVALDENNLKATIEMLKKLSKDKQIIYFSCHPSRTIS